LGFVFWLGQALDSAGYNAIPAQNIRAANELIRKHKLLVDVLVFDPVLPDAFAFIQRLRQSQRHTRIVAAVPEDWADLPPMSGVDTWLRKPHRFTLMATLPWIKLIQGLYSPRSEGLQKTPRLLKS
jgi:DNA-binding response OmpR family regulator